MRLHMVKPNTKIDFLGVRRIAFMFSALLLAGSIVVTAVMGLNFGIDFRGGILIEVRTQEPANVAEMRTMLDGLSLGEISLQRFGDDQEVLIRVQRQEGAEAEQIQAIGGQTGVGRRSRIPSYRIRRPDRGPGVDRGGHPGDRSRAAVDPGLHLVPL